MDRTEELHGGLLTHVLSDLILRIQEAIRNLMLYQDKPLHLAINDLLEAWFELTRQLFPDPDSAIQAQMLYWNDYLLLCKDLHRRLAQQPPIIESTVNAWKNAILLEFVEKYHFLITQHVGLLIKNLFAQDGELGAQKIAFYSNRFAEAFSLAHLTRMPLVDAATERF